MAASEQALTQERLVVAKKKNADRTAAAAHGAPWSDAETALLERLVSLLGERSWSLVWTHLPGRSAAQCRKRWRAVTGADVPPPPLPPPPPPREPSRYTAAAAARDRVGPSRSQHYRATEAGGKEKEKEEEEEEEEEDSSCIEATVRLRLSLDAALSCQDPLEATQQDQPDSTIVVSRLATPNHAETQTKPEPKPSPSPSQTRARTRPEP